MEETLKELLKLLQEIKAKLDGPGPKFEIKGSDVETKTNGISTIKIK